MFFQVSSVFIDEKFIFIHAEVFILFMDITLLNVSAVSLTRSLAWKEEKYLEKKKFIMFLWYLQLKNEHNRANKDILIIWVLYNYIVTM